MAGDDTANTDHAPPAGAPLTAAQVTPADIKLSLTAQTLAIDWQDGHRSEFELGRLRRICPCATCRQERDAPPTSLPILNLPAGASRIEAVDAELMGHYAINLKWSDGHDSGIYDYRFLRALDGKAT